MKKLSLDERAAARKAAVDAILNAPPAPLPPTWAEAAEVIRLLQFCVTYHTATLDDIGRALTEAADLLARIEEMEKVTK